MPELILAASKSTFRSLSVRNYRLYFIGQIVSVSGTWMQSLAQMWLVLQLTGSGVALGITTALQFVPILFAGAWGGVVADRLDKRSVLIWTQSAMGMLALTLGLITLLGVTELWMIYALAFLLGCVTLVDHPTRQSFVQEMVGPEHVVNAVGLNSTVFTAARVVGPAVAGGIIATVGIPACFLVNAASFVAVIVALRAMDQDAFFSTDPVPRGKGQLRAGLRYTWSHRDLRMPLILLAVASTLAYNFRILLPLLARDSFHGGAGLFGLLSAVMGAGTLIGALLVASRTKPTRRWLVASAASFGLLVIATGLAPTLGAELVVLVPMGAASVALTSATNTMLQLNSASHMRGRVLALFSVVLLGSTPIGSPLMGWIAEQFGVRFAFVIAGAATTFAAGIAAWRLAQVRRVRLAGADADASEADIAAAERVRSAA